MATCEATDERGMYPYLDAVPCGKSAIGTCRYCGMECCSYHFDDGYCAGTDCRDEEQREANAKALLNSWEIGESWQPKH